MPAILYLESLSPISHLRFIQSSLGPIFALVVALFQGSSCSFLELGLDQRTSLGLREELAMSSFLPEGFPSALCKMILLFLKLLLLRASLSFATSIKVLLLLFSRAGLIICITKK